jgi:hypothetical protein
MSDSGRDAAPRTPETNQNTFWRIGGVFLISVAACFSILAFRVIFNCIFIDFCCMRDFSLLRRMRYWLRRMFCLSADPDDLVQNGSRGRNTRPFNLPSMTSRARKDLVKKHLVTGVSSNNDSFTIGYLLCFFLIFVKMIGNHLYRNTSLRKTNYRIHIYLEVTI